MLYTHPLRFCPIEWWQYIDSLASAICLYFKIDMRMKFDGTESKRASVQDHEMNKIELTLEEWL